MGRKTELLIISALIVTILTAGNITAEENIFGEENKSLKGWILKGKLPAKPQRSTTEFPLSDQQNTGKWSKYEPMTDEFTNTKLDSKKWWPNNPEWAGRQPGYFYHKNVTLSDGKLHLTMRKEEPEEMPKDQGYHTYTTAAIQGKKRVLYGYFEVKCKPMKSAGSSSFFFYQNAKDLWTEIDVYEIGGKAPGFEKIYNMNVHVFKTPEGERHWAKHEEWESPTNLADDYHVYAVEWNAEKIKWYFDGVLVRWLENTHWHQPLSLNLNSETMEDWLGLPMDQDLPSTYSIEYVRAWKSKDETLNSDKVATRKCEDSAVEAGTAQAGLNTLSESAAEQVKTLPELQQEYLSWKFGLFMHFNMATFNNQGWANGYEDPATFAPGQLDCGQWADAAVAAGMKYAVLTVKHTGGWCLWPSAVTDHDITSFKNYKNGKGDIVREFVDVFRSRGIKVGFYYCMPGYYINMYGNQQPEDKPVLHALPPEAKGDYVGFIKKQFAELLTQYGPVDVLWVDQYAHNFTLEQWPSIMKYIKSLQPNCIIIGNNSRDLKTTNIYSYELPVYAGKTIEELVPSDNTIATEVCDILGPAWFWNENRHWSKERRDESKLLPVEEVLSRLNTCNIRDANYLLNASPDNRELIPELTVKRLKEIGEKRGNPSAQQPNYSEQIKKTVYSDLAEVPGIDTMSEEQMHWEKILKDHLGGFYYPLYIKAKKAGQETSWDYVKDVPGLPRVLLIGDSISDGYTIPVRHILKGKVNVHRAPENCGPSEYGLKKLDLWLGDGNWDLITFNFGIHDRFTPDKDYRTRLDQITKRLRATGAKLVWMNTTPIPEGAKIYVESGIDRINKVATSYMTEKDIPILDLNKAITPLLDKYQIPNDCHYKVEGYEFMGDLVAKIILEELHGDTG